jgi:hypothetical protein
MKEILFGRIGKICTIDGGTAGVGGGSAWSNQALERIMNPEKYKISEIRGIKETDGPTNNSDYLKIVVWMSHPAVRPHLRATTIPQIEKKEDLPLALREADRYYHNKNRVDEKTGQFIEDDPQKIIPIVAVNGLGETVASLVIRLKGDPLAKVSEENKEEGKAQNGSVQGKTKNLNRIAGIENVVVDPSLHNAHFGTQLMSAALDIVFCNKLYNGKSAIAARLWIRSDSKAGDIGPKMDFFRSFGFEVIAGNWREYAKARGIPNPDNIDGQQYEITKARWEEVKREDVEKEKEKQKLTLPPGIINEASLRVSHAPVERI